MNCLTRTGYRSSSLSQQLVLATILLFISPFLIFPTHFVPGTLLALLLLAILLLVTAGQKPTLLHVPLLVLAIWMLLSIVVSADMDLSLTKATGLLLGFAYLRLSATMICTRKGLGIGLWVFLCLALGFSAVGVVSTAWVAKVPFLVPFIGELPGNLVSLPDSATNGVQANQLASTILFIWPLLLAATIFGAVQHRLLRPGLWILMAGMTLLLLLTQSRSGWIAALATTLLLVSCLVWFRSPGRHRLIMLGWLSLLFGLLAYGFLIGPTRISQFILDPVETTVVGDLSSLGFRLDTWRWAIEAIKSFPFTGTGLGTFRVVAPRFYPIQVPPTYDIAHAHNIFLQVALDVGLPGLIAYLALLMLVFWEGWQAARLDKELRPYAIGLMGGLVALHIFGLTDALALGAKPGLLFWINIGLLTAMRRVRQTDGAVPLQEP